MTRSPALAATMSGGAPSSAATTGPSASVPSNVASPAGPNPRNPRRDPRAGRPMRARAARPRRYGESRGAPDSLGPTASRAVRRAPRDFRPFSRSAHPGVRFRFHRRRQVVVGGLLGQDSREARLVERRSTACVVGGVNVSPAARPASRWVAGSSCSAGSRTSSCAARNGRRRAQKLVHDRRVAASRGQAS
jgi:hypothetical protein